MRRCDLNIPECEKADSPQVTPGLGAFCGARLLQEKPDWYYKMYLIDGLGGADRFREHDGLKHAGRVDVGAMAADFAAAIPLVLSDKKRFRNISETLTLPSPGVPGEGSEPASKAGFVFGLPREFLAKGCVERDLGRPLVDQNHRITYYGSRPGALPFSDFFKHLPQNLIARLRPGLQCENARTEVIVIERLRRVDKHLWFVEFTIIVEIWDHRGHPPRRQVLVNMPVWPRNDVDAQAYDLANGVVNLPELHAVQFMKGEPRNDLSGWTATTLSTTLSLFHGGCALKLLLRDVAAVGVVDSH